MGLGEGDFFFLFDSGSRSSELWRGRTWDLALIFVEGGIGLVFVVEQKKKKKKNLLLMLRIHPNNIHLPFFIFLS